jgi:PAS domain S-box-containing protein
MILAYEALSQRIKRPKAFWWQIASGFLLGGIGISVMFNPWVLSPGVIFDTRSVILGLCGLFFGTIPTIIAVILTGAVRLWIGGQGAFVGVLVIFCSGAIGLIWRHFLKGGSRSLSLPELYLFGIVVHAVMILCMLFLPAEPRMNFFSKAAIPIIIIYPMATALAGWAMAAREEKNRLEREKEEWESALRFNQARLESLVEILQHPTEDLQSFLEFSLEKAVEFTESEVGFLSFYNEKEKTLKVNVFSKGALKECQISNLSQDFSLEEGGYWGETIRQRKPVIDNNFQAPSPLHKGYPPGHIAIKKLLEVPIIRKGEIVGLLALANKKRDYEEVDAYQTSLLMETVWRTVERKQAEESLRRERERVQRYFEVAGFIFVSLNPKGEVTLINRKGCEILGYKPEEIIGKNWFDNFLPPLEKNMVKEVFQKVVSGEMEGVSNFENRIFTKNGEERLIAWNNTFLKDEKGRVTEVFSAGEDITEKRRAQEELRERETKLTLALESARMGIWEFNPQSEQIFLSEDSQKILEITREKPAWKLDEFLSLVHPEDREKFQNFIHKVSRLGLTEDQEIRFLSDPKIERFVGFRGRGLNGEGESPKRVIGVLWDFSERKKKEEELEKAKADFLLAVSHELKTPLFLLGANLELLKSLPPEERLSQFLSLERVFLRNFSRLRFLVENLIDSQRSPTMGTHLNFQREDLNPLLVALVEELEVLEQKKKIKIVLDLENLPPIEIDKEAITRVMHNLLTNAIKFSPPAGQVMVRTLQEGDNAVLEVQDQGPGIPEQEIPLLFQPFSRAKQAIQSVIPGAGLGLYVSKILVEAHGGTINIASQIGKGTTVTVRLPIYRKGRPD